GFYRRQVGHAQTSVYRNVYHGLNGLDSLRHLYLLDLTFHQTVLPPRIIRQLNNLFIGCVTYIDNLDMLVNSISQLKPSGLSCRLCLDYDVSKWEKPLPVKPDSPFFALVTHLRAPVNYKEPVVKICEFFPRLRSLKMKQFT